MKWDKTTHTNHTDKVASMRPGIDNSSPKNHLHLQKKLKKLQLEKERLAEIRRNNEILHERVQVLTRMKGKQAQTQQQNRDRYLKAANMSHMQARTRENQRIQGQNEVMLQRIEAKRPNYNHLKWLLVRKRELNILKNISSYPQKFISQGKQIKELIEADKEKKNETMKKNNESKKSSDNGKEKTIKKNSDNGKEKINESSLKKINESSLKKKINESSLKTNDSSLKKTNDSSLKKTPIQEIKKSNQNLNSNQKSNQKSNSTSQQNIDSSQTIKLKSEETKPLTSSLRELKKAPSVQEIRKAPSAELQKQDIASIEKTMMDSLKKSVEHLQGNL